MQWLRSKSLITNLIALLCIAIGWCLAEPHILAIGSYAFSGAITNWLAIHMLFEKIPFLYGSGVIPNRFNDFKLGIKNLIMDQFFTVANIERFFEESSDETIHQIDLTPLLAIIDYDKIFQSLIEAIESSSLGGMLSFVGGVDALLPLKAPFIEKLQNTLKELANETNFKDALAKQHAFFHPEKVVEKVGHIVEQRLAELTPQMVKFIIQQMIRKHLGWLVVWGGVFGGLIGLVVSFV